MSYLDGPRLVFAGEFQADVSTVNNDVRHFDVDTFEERFQQHSSGTTANGRWHPTGSGAFRLLGCRVRGACGADGRPSAGDCVLRATIEGSSDRVAAKIVDLDPQWQLSSELWGLRIAVVSGEDMLLAGDFEPAGFRDIWLRSVGNVAKRSARYTSVLANVVWTAPGRSPFVDALRAATAGNVVSVRLVTLAYETDRRSQRFTLGTVLGAIGPHRAGEPRRFVRGRRLAPKQLLDGVVAPVVNFCEGVVSPEGDAVSVDLGNALPWLDGSGTMADIGDVRIGLLADDTVDEGDEVAEGPGFLPLGDPVPYRTAGWLLDTGGLVRAGVPDSARIQLSSRPLALVGSTPTGKGTVLMRETPAGLYVRADEDLHRVEAGMATTVSVYASRFGLPVEGAQVRLALRPPAQGGGGDPNAPNQPTAPIPLSGTPPEAVRLDPLGPTDAEGRATYRITCSDPGSPRGYIDGQLYQFRVGLPGLGNPRAHPFDFVSVLVFDDFGVPDAPTWEDHIRPILTQYGNLYPIMSRRLVDLTDYDAVVENAELLRFAFELGVDDPNHMPVTRDLSHAKRSAILRWLDAPLRGDGREPRRSEGRLRTRSLAADATPAPPVDDAEMTDSKLEFVRSDVQPVEPPDGTGKLQAKR